MQWARNHIVVMSAEAYRSQLEADLLTDEDLAYADDLGV
jgi:hypothetical protein